MHHFLRSMLQLLKYVWAAPWTVVGLFVGLLTLATGGGTQCSGKILEFYGGAARWLLQHAPIVGNAAAMTLGHVVLGQTIADLHRARRHELVHVRQYERWGPLFVPAYLLCSLILWLWGRDAYWDNPFERDAYDEADVDATD